MLVLWEDLFDTDRDWWIMVLQMQPFPVGETMPQAIMEFLIHEKGFPCGADKQERTFPKPAGYVEWKEKLRHFKACAGYKPPPTSENGEPTELTWALLKRYPVVVSNVEDPDPLNPRGSG